MVELGDCVGEDVLVCDALLRSVSLNVGVRDRLRVLDKLFACVWLGDCVLVGDRVGVRLLSLDGEPVSLWVCVGVSVTAAACSSHTCSTHIINKTVRIILREILSFFDLKRNLDRDFFLVCAPVTEAKNNPKEQLRYFSVMTQHGLTVFSQHHK